MEKKSNVSIKPSLTTYTTSDITAVSSSMTVSEVSSSADGMYSTYESL